MRTGGYSPVESSSESKTLERVSLSPSMNSNPCEETNSSTSWSLSKGVAAVTAEVFLSAENRMASLISGSSELIASLDLSTRSLYGYAIGKAENAAYSRQSVKIWTDMRVVSAPGRDSIQIILQGRHRIHSVWSSTGRQLCSRNGRLRYNICLRCSMGSWNRLFLLPQKWEQG